jgi:uncharacterized protein with GYD domain
MAVEINNLSSLKIKLSLGLDGNGKAVVRSKTFGALKHDAVTDDVLAVANAFVGLGQHDLMDVVKVDDTSISA